MPESREVSCQHVIDAACIWLDGAVCKDVSRNPVMNCGRLMVGTDRLRWRSRPSPL